MNEANPFAPEAQEMRLPADMRHDVRVSNLRKQLSAGILMTVLGGAGFTIGTSETLLPNPSEPTPSKTESVLMLVGGMGLGGFIAAFGGITIYDADRRLRVYGE